MVEATLGETLFWSILRALLVASCALLPLLVLRRAWEGTRSGRTRNWMMAAAALPFFIPELLTGFHYRVQAALWASELALRECSFRGGTLRTAATAPCCLRRYRRAAAPSAKPRGSQRTAHVEAPAPCCPGSIGSAGFCDCWSPESLLHRWRHGPSWQSPCFRSLKPQL
ncbi:MAG UNVERIFIED_CONTAM: hypothetical protein LVR18_48905 [Planctomycetaceae bacterium]|jgi:hypothetical protein